MGDQELTNYDVFLLRRFCADELGKYLEPMREFWEHSASYKESGRGEHELLDARFAGAAGYMVGRRVRKGSPLYGVAAYPFVRTRALRLVPADGKSRFILRRALAEPVEVEEFRCVMDGDRRIAFLTEEAYGDALLGRSCEACVVLGREEAYAILAGRTLERTRRKLMRAFDMDDDEREGGAEK